ncbi:hypothetical protein K6V78_09155 [Streptococcus gallolyticus]|uniref:hypothetical protein n=1 Tax=Streptococcus hepaticus TaxID=3349163 RepID=UPI001C98E368|nr:hypothetical protein [Streptococcus gallolyticus]MBY5041668.1 hypothetical protein [Streptococcus gallolyticus]
MSIQVTSKYPGFFKNTLILNKIPTEKIGYGQTLEIELNDEPSFLNVEGNIWWSKVAVSNGDKLVIRPGIGFFRL